MDYISRQWQNLMFPIFTTGTFSKGVMLEYGAGLHRLKHQRMQGLSVQISYFKREAMYGGGRPWESLLLLYRAPRGNGGRRLGLISTKCGKAKKTYSAILSWWGQSSKIIQNQPNTVSKEAWRVLLGRRWRPGICLLSSRGDLHCCPDFNYDKQNLYFLKHIQRGI